MRRGHVVVLLVVLCGIAVFAAAGDLWISCEPGLEIFLDGQRALVSDNGEYGLLLAGVTTGDHTIRVEKSGFVPLEFFVAVGPASNQIVVGELGPEIKDGVQGATDGDDPEQLVGTIEITSDPSECNVKFAGQRILKTQPTMTFPNIPVGEHKVWFESLGTVLSTSVDVQEGETAQVRVDFRDRRIAIAGAASDVPGDGSEVEGEPPATEPECIEYWVEVMRTDDPDAIEPARSALEDQGYPLYHQKLITIEDDGTLPVYKLRVGPIARDNMARRVAGLLKHGGFKTSWVVPEECQPSPEPKAKHDLIPLP
jgi:hypothetical protein